MHRCFHLVTHETEEMERIIRTYSTSLFKLCLVLLCNQQDAEDVLQETFLRYVSKRPSFTDAAHEKAWLFRVASNLCKSVLRTATRTVFLAPNELEQLGMAENDRDILLDVMALPPKYKTVLLLYYLEGYKTDEIARILHISPAAACKRLQYARDMLRLEYQRKEPCS